MKNIIKIFIILSLLLIVKSSYAGFSNQEYIICSTPIYALYDEVTGSSTLHYNNYSISKDSYGYLSGLGTSGSTSTVTSWYAVQAVQCVEYSWGAQSCLVTSTKAAVNLGDGVTEAGRVADSTEAKQRFFANGCPNCDDELAAKTAECEALGGWIVDGWDDTLCIGTCVDPCADERAGKITECESIGMQFDPDAWNQETCTGQCRPDCTDEYNALNEECCFGIRTFDYDTCSGDCFDCSYKLAEAEVLCAGKGGLLSFDCVDRRVYGGTSTCAWPYKCQDDDAPTEPPIDPVDPDPPPEDPTPEPEKDPNDTPDEEQNKTLDAIKSDTGKLVTNTNTANKYLGNIDKNLPAIARNQGVINNSVKDISKALGATNQKLGNINNSIGDLSDAIGKLGNNDGKVDTGLEDNIAAANDEEKYEGPMPEQPEFDATLENEAQYSENEDGVGKATEQAGTEWALQETDLNNATKPYNAQITTSGANACITGSIRQVPVNICFDRPWMLQGYAIMKLILIAMGYLQTAMLLNRGLAG